MILPEANQIERSLGQTDPLSNDCLIETRSMKLVSPDAVFHIFAPEPDCASASEWRIAGGEDDLLVGAHSKNLMRLDQRSSSQLLRACP